MTPWLERLFLLIIFSLGFMEPNLSYNGIILPTTDFIFVVLMIGLTWVMVRRRRRVEWDRSFVYLGAFALAAALSALFSARPEISAIKLLGVLYLVGLAFAAFHFISSYEMARKVVLVWLAASTIVSLVATITVVLFFADRESSWHELFLHHYGSLPEGNYPRVQSTFAYPAMLCNYLTVGSLLTIGAKRAQWLSAHVSSAVLLLHVVAAAFSLTPGLGGFVAALALWAGWLFFDSGKTRLGWIATAAAVLVTSTFTIVGAVSIWPIETSPYTFQLLGIRLDPTQRLLTWQEAFATFASEPIFGKGIGLGVASVSFRTPSGQLQMLTDAHNTWLSVAAQSGIIGLAAVMALSGHLIRRGVSLTSPSDSLGWIRRSVVIAFFGSFMLQGLVGSFEDARHLWVLMGLTFALERLEQSLPPAH